MFENYKRFYRWERKGKVATDEKEKFLQVKRKVSTDEKESFYRWEGKGKVATDEKEKFLQMRRKSFYRWEEIVSTDEKEESVTLDDSNI